MSLPKMSRGEEIFVTVLTFVLSGILVTEILSIVFTHQLIPEPWMVLIGTIAALGVIALLIWSSTLGARMFFQRWQKPLAIAGSFVCLGVLLSWMIGHFWSHQFYPMWKIVVPGFTLAALFMGSIWWWPRPSAIVFRRSLWATMRERGWPAIKRWSNRPGRWMKLRSIRARRNAARKTHNTQPTTTRNWALMIIPVLGIIGFVMVILWMQGGFNGDLHDSWMVIALLLEYGWIPLVLLIWGLYLIFRRRPTVVVRMPVPTPAAGATPTPTPTLNGTPVPVDEPFWKMIRFLLGTATLVMWGLVLYGRFYLHRFSWNVFWLAVLVTLFWYVMHDARAQAPRTSTTGTRLSFSWQPVLAAIVLIVVLVWGIKFVATLVYNEQWPWRIVSTETEEIAPVVWNQGLIHWVTVGLGNVVDYTDQHIFPSYRPVKMATYYPTSRRRGDGVYPTPLKPPIFDSNADSTIMTVGFNPTPGFYWTRVNDLSQQYWRVKYVRRVYHRGRFTESIGGRPYKGGIQYPTDLENGNALNKPDYVSMLVPEGAICYRWGMQSSPKFIRDGEIIHRPLPLVLRLLAWIPPYPKTDREVYVGIAIPQTSDAARAVNGTIIIRFERVDANGNALSRPVATKQRGFSIIKNSGQPPCVVVHCALLSPGPMV